MNLLEQWNDSEKHRLAGLMTEQEEFDAIISRAEAPRASDAIRLGELARILGIDPKTIPPRLSAIIGKAQAERECVEARELLKVLRTQEAELKQQMGAVITGEMTDLVDAICLIYYTQKIGTKIPLEPLAHDAFLSDFLAARGWKQAQGNCWRNPKTGLSPVKAQAILNAFREICDPIAPLAKSWLAKRAFQSRRATAEQIKPVESSPEADAQSEVEPLEAAQRQLPQSEMSFEQAAQDVSSRGI